MTSKQALRIVANAMPKGQDVGRVAIKAGSLAATAAVYPVKVAIGTAPGFEVFNPITAFVPLAVRYTVRQARKLAS